MPTIYLQNEPKDWLPKPRKEPTMKVFKHQGSGALIVTDEHYAVIEAKGSGYTAVEQIKNAKRRIIEMKTGIFELDAELTELADPTPFSANKEVDPQSPETPETPENPNNSQEA